MTSIHDGSVRASYDDEFFGTNLDFSFGDNFSTTNPRISSMMYSPNFTSEFFTPQNSRAIMNDWINTGMSRSQQFPIGGTRATDAAPASQPLNPVEFQGLDATASTEPYEIGTEALSTEVGASVLDAVPGAGELFIANQIMGQISGGIFNSQYDTDLTSARAYATTAFRYGSGSAMNPQNYLSSQESLVSQEKANMSIGSMFGPFGSMIAGSINSHLTPSINLDTTFSTGGYMSNGTSAASVDTSTTAPTQ